MSETAISVVVAVLSFIGTTAGSITGIIVSNRLSNYRIEQLEKKVENVDNSIRDYANNVNEIRERMIIAEQSVKSAHHRLDDIAQQMNIHERRE